MKQDFHDDVMMLEPGALIERLERLTSYEDPFRFDRADQFKAMMLETLTHASAISSSSPHCRWW